MLRSALVLAAASLVLGAAPATAQSVPTTIDACYVPLTGTLYRINTPASPAPGAPSKCSSPSHVPFQWNQQGPQGPKGDPGPQGPKGDTGAGLSGFSEVTVQGSPTADAGGRRSMNASCPAGTMAIGGSYAIFANGGNYAWGIVPVSSGTFTTTFNPADPHNAFFVLTVDAPGYAQVPFFRVVVKCATVQ
jgi:hypothetical protein